MNELRELSGQIYFGNDLRDWVVALVVFVLLLTILPLTRAAVEKRLRKPHRSKAALEVTLALIARTTRLFLFAVAVWLSIRLLSVPAAVERIIDIALLIVIWLQVALWGTTLVVRLVEARSHAADAAAGAASLNILRFVATVAVWAIALLLLLANLGVKIMPLVAGLGIGGIAIALAVQNVLGDLLASLSIALDKPFTVGDFLVLGNEKGTVEQIGIKSTRLRSTTGEQIVMSNSDLLQSRLRNYGLLPERRAELALRIAYETPREQIAEIPAVIEAAIRAQRNARFERAHLARFGDYALIYEAVYHVQDRDLTVFMDAQQAIHLRLLDELGRRDIDIVYPTTRSMTPPPPPKPA